MCFRIKNRKNKPKMQVAKEDILVYKVIQKDGWGIIFNLRIKGREVKWKKGFHYTETEFANCLQSFDSPCHGLCWDVNGDAFHTKRTRKLAEYFRDEDEIIVEMYIPAGSFYYKNEKEYVSSDLVWY